MAGTEQEQRIGRDGVSLAVIDRATGERFAEGFALKVLIDRACGDGVEAKKAMWDDAATMAADLAGPDPSPAEALLARAVTADYLAWSYHRYSYDRAETEGMSIKLSEHHQRRIDRTHRRMLASLRTLAVVRRLARPMPTIKVRAEVANIAQIAGDSGQAANRLEAP
jgi:hypothetical protein